METPVAPSMPCQKFEEELWEWCIQQNFKNSFRALWKLMSPEDCVWENHYQIIMKTKMQEKEITALQFRSQICSYAEK